MTALMVYAARAGAGTDVAVAVGTGVEVGGTGVSVGGTGVRVGNGVGLEQDESNTNESVMLAINSVGRRRMGSILLLSTGLSQLGSSNTLPGRASPRKFRAQVAVDRISVSRGLPRPA